MFTDYNTFTNNRPITKSMLEWWAFYQKDQKIFDSDKSFHIEHIYAKKDMIQMVIYRIKRILN